MTRSPCGVPWLRLLVLRLAGRRTRARLALDAVARELGLDPDEAIGPEGAIVRPARDGTLWQIRRHGREWTIFRHDRDDRHAGLSSIDVSLGVFHLVLRGVPAVVAASLGDRRLADIVAVDAAIGRLAVTDVRERDDIVTLAFDQRPIKRRRP